MSEIKPDPIEIDKEQEDLTPIKQIDAALKACTFGRFQILLLFIAFWGHLAATLVTASTAYLLPVAECDLNMSLLQKGLLNAMPYIGMLMSTVIAGFLTDAFGRKIFLVGGFAGQFVFTVLEASGQTYEVIITAKFFEGLLFAMCFNPLIAIASEFCSNDIRDRIVLLQSSFVSIGHILIALMSWGILIYDYKISFFGGYFILNMWNIYLYAVSLCSLVSCIMYAIFVPESPKYLVTQKKYDQAREILVKVYVKNTGKPASTYPYIDIWKDKMGVSLDKSSKEQDKFTFKNQIVTGLYNVKPMFKKPLVVYITLICTTNFIIMCMYNVFRLWFPQLSAIVENYQSEERQDLCIMLDAYTNDLKKFQNTTQSDVCVPTKSGNETYINSIIIGFVALVPYLVSGMLMKKVGKKTLLIAAAILSVIGSVSLRWANSTFAIVSLFSMTIAITQVMIGLNQATTVELFGTTTRNLAVSLIMVSGRIGTLTGNISFPVLLDMGCAVPFFTITGLMVCVTILFVFMPSRK